MTGRIPFRAVVVALLLIAAPGMAAAGAAEPRKLADGLEVTDAAVDVAQVLGLARLGMARPDLTGPVRFSGPKALPQVSGALIQGGFGLGTYSVMNDQPIKGRERVRMATGLLAHKDLFGRGEWSSFAAGFVTEGDKVTIHKAKIEPYYPLSPTVRFSFVPVADAPADLLDGRYTSVSLMRFLYEVASPARTGLPAGDYYAFALFMDRLQPDAHVSLTVSQRPGGARGYAQGRVIVADDGWFAVALRMRLDPAAGPAFLKTVLVPPGRDRERDAIVASVLSTTELR